MPTKAIYERMMRKWSEYGSPHLLNDEQAKAVIAERVHPDNRK
jgi:hypothetical protein